MKNIIYISLGLLLLTSCLKKLEEVDQATNNIFDPKFEGEQWYSLDTVYEYTNFLNAQYIKFELQIKEEYTPRLKPTVIDLVASVNNDDDFWIQAGLNNKGRYSAGFSILPDGSSNYCLDLGVGVIDNGDSLVINRFTECKDI